MRLPASELYDGLVQLFKKAPGQVSYRANYMHFPPHFQVFTLDRNGDPLRISYFPAGTVYRQRVDAAFTIQAKGLTIACVTRSKREFVTLQYPFVEGQNPTYKPNFGEYTPESLAALTTTIQQAYPYPSVHEVDRADQRVWYRYLFNGKTVALVHWYLNHDTEWPGTLQPAIFLAEDEKIPVVLAEGSPEILCKLIARESLQLIDDRRLGFYRHHGHRFAIWGGNSTLWSNVLFGEPVDGRAPSFPHPSTEERWIQSTKLLGVREPYNPPRLGVPQFS